MKFTIQKNIILENPETKPFLADTFVPDNKEKLPLVIFCHGYKGYKDWGAWNLMAEKFAENGFFFKANFELSAFRFWLIKSCISVCKRDSKFKTISFW